MVAVGVVDVGAGGVVCAVAAAGVPYSGFVGVVLVCMVCVVCAGVGSLVGTMAAVLCGLTCISFAHGW